ncbi:MAG TPA: hypothetical protein VNU44_09625 [Bryobacteraceae bacterium]|nr:hypothetical protein [Bryobacteraceae bacterium]
MDGEQCEALAAFSSLSDKNDRDVRSRFDYWIDGGINDNYFQAGPTSLIIRNPFRLGGGRAKYDVAYTDSSAIHARTTRASKRAFSLDMIARQQKTLISRFLMSPIA